MRQQGIPSELFLAFIVAMVLGVAYFVEYDRLCRIQEEAARVEEVVVAASTQKRASEVLGDDEEGDEDSVGRKKQAYHKWERDRARLAVHKDHWGSPTPLFNGRMFQRVFRVTRQIAQMNKNGVVMTLMYRHVKDKVLVHQEMHNFVNPPKRGDQDEFDETRNTWMDDQGIVEAQVLLMSKVQKYYDDTNN